MQLCMSHLIMLIFQCHSDRANLSMLPDFLVNTHFIGGAEPIYITSLSILNFQSSEWQFMNWLFGYSSY
jgi:hypothetical protein